jgi:hypothetical protein
LQNEQERLVRRRTDAELELASAKDEWSRRRALEEVRDIDLKMNRVTRQMNLYEMKHVNVLAE